MRKPNYDKFPATKVDAQICVGWDQIISAITAVSGGKPIAVDTYPGAGEEEIASVFGKAFGKVLMTRSLMKGEDENMNAEEASDVIEEAANIIAGRCASVVNDLKDVDMRISPPGTIVGKNIRIANFKISSYYIEAQTRFGNICMNVGFAEGE